MISVYEMKYKRCDIPSSDIECIPFDESYIEQYMMHYNDAFYPMRKALDIKPYNWYSDLSTIRKKSADIYLLTDGDDLIGSVACYGNEVDDLFVSNRYRNMVYGRKLLLWGMNHIREEGGKEILLHVAEWNQNALKMYIDIGFETERVEYV